jgi:hypothetical protein
MLRAAFASVLTLLLLLPGQAHADRVKQLIHQMTTNDDYKVRLSAALNLAKLEDPRSVPAFIQALGDSDHTVRGVAARSLGRLVDRRTRPELRDRAIAELRRVAANDSNNFVRRQAQKSFEELRQLEGGAAPAPGGVFIDLGGMSANAGDKAKMRRLMRTTTEKTFAKRASGMVTAWPGGRAPTKQELDSSKTHAFHVDGTLTELTRTAQGSSTIVACKVSMLIATYPEKSMFGFLDGGARVQAGSSDRDIAFAEEDCVVAVVEDLVTKRIIPTIQTRAQ